MKRKDLKKIVIIIFVSVIVSFFISGFIFSDPETEPLEVQTAEPLSSSFSPPSSEYFNENSINPTRLIRIGEDLGNETPFGRDDE